MMDTRPRRDRAWPRRIFTAAGAPMLGSHAVNRDGTTYTEPTILELNQIMERGTLFIAPHNTELIEQLGSWHRDEKERIVKTKDDLAQALRIALMTSGRSPTPIPLMAWREISTSTCSASRVQAVCRRDAVA